MTETVTKPKRKTTGPDPGRVLNYTSQVTPQKSLSEIQGLLIAHGALSFTVLFDTDRTVMGVEFRLRSNSGEDKTYVMQANWHSVRQRMVERHNADVRKRHKNSWTAERYVWTDNPGSYSHNVPKDLDDQAKRTAWRILKDSIEVMLNLGTAGVMDPGQVFFGFGRLEDGATVYDAYTEHRALPAGNEP